MGSNIRQVTVDDLGHTQMAQFCGDIERDCLDTS